MPRQPFGWLTGRSYGPIVGETSRATNYGPRGNRLGPTDVAASPNILAAHPLGSTFTYNGRTYTINDSSFVSPGNPTRNTLEFRDTPNDQRINYNDIQWNSASSAPGWHPKEGGIVGKIASHMPGVAPYLAGQSIFDSIFDLITGRNRAPSSNLQPTTGGASYPPAPNAVSPGDPNAPAPFVPPPWVMPGDPNAPAPFVPPPWVTPTFGMHSAGRGVDPGYVDPRSANAFISGLIDWNGPGQTNPSAGEGGVYETGGAGWQARHPIGSAWWNPGGRASGHSGGGRLPVGFQ